MEKLQLQKGDSIEFLGYTIRNSGNNDGIILSKSKDYKLYETHLGNYGTGIKQNVDNAKQAALIHFMLARPETFATLIIHKIMSGSKSGCVHEWYILRDCLLRENIYKTEADFPAEIAEPGDGINCLIYFRGLPLKWIK